MSDRNPRGRQWMITMHQIDDQLVAKVQEYLSCDDVKYGIYGIEEPQNTEKHMHIYINFRKRTYKSTIKKNLGSNKVGYCELAKYTEQNCINYVMKDGDYHEFGEKTNETMKKLEKENHILKLLKEVCCLSWAEFMEKYPIEAFNHKNRLLEWKFAHTRYITIWNGELKMKNLWLFGKAGTGKSRWAHSQADLDSIYKKNVNRWWDGYDDFKTKIVLIEDFPIDNKDWLINILKIWSDRYPFNGEIKGGTVKIDPGKWYLIITSNHSISEVFENSNIEDVNAIKRRFSEIEMKNNSIVQWAKINIEELNK